MKERRKPIDIVLIHGLPVYPPSGGPTLFVRPLVRLQACCTCLLAGGPSVRLSAVPLSTKDVRDSYLCCLTSTSLPTDRWSFRRPAVPSSTKVTRDSYLCCLSTAHRPTDRRSLSVRPSATLCHICACLPICCDSTTDWTATVRPSDYPCVPG